MSTAASLGGWIAAALVAAVVVIGWRVLEARMEAVARACHELRGPLTAARLGLSPPGPAGVSPGRLRAIDTELGRAALALDDLSEVPGGRVRLRRLARVDVRTSVDDSVEAWRGIADAAGVTLTVRWTGREGAIWGDRLRLAQATGNLLANAIEHGGAGVAVRGEVRSGWVRIEVADDGPGLPMPVREAMPVRGLCRR
ncbi:MAG: HAMP domain-containing sensor histidine kinase, partial [Solirubrobacteraceae bacterium]